jgi:cytochrome P450
VPVAFAPLVQDEPYAAYRELRESWPVYRNEARGFWALSRFEDVQRAAREWTAFSSAEGVNLDDTLSLTGDGNFIAADPPDHDRLRKVVRERFTPASVAAMEAEIRHDVRRALRAAAREGGFDAADALAWAIPVARSRGSSRFRCATSRYCAAGCARSSTARPRATACR